MGGNYVKIHSLLCKSNVRSAANSQVRWNQETIMAQWYASAALRDQTNWKCSSKETLRLPTMTLIYHLKELIHILFKCRTACREQYSRSSSFICFSRRLRERTTNTWNPNPIHRREHSLNLCFMKKSCQSAIVHPNEGPRAVKMSPHSLLIPLK